MVRYCTNTAFAVGVGTYMFMNYPQRLRLQDILDSVGHANNTAGSIEQKMGDFYASGMDTNAINQRDYEPIKPILARIDSISDIVSLIKFAANEAKAGNNSFLISGQAVQKTRGEIMASEVDGYLGEALGQLYVKKYFGEDAKKRMLELVNNLQKAFAARIDKLDWMSDSTKQKAKEKLFTLTKKIGYPDKWRDYSNVTIVKSKHFENIISAAANNYQYQLAKLNKPVDKTEWFTTPSTVTAYYNPSANEIVFSAGILQPPYFDNNVDDALNYGGIGMVIGHEMTHAFDDQGAQFDKEGNVKNWWTKDDYEFKAKTGGVINLYNTFTVLDTVHVKGAMTVGENTADVGGVAIAYDAFKLTKEGGDTAKLGGFTPDQRFFISVAHIWQVKMKDEFLRLWINNKPHSPPIWRVNSPLKK